MSVLIKGMNMPKSCDVCILSVPIFDYAKHKCVNICLLKNSIGCPLIEVPTPHGRLIDADKLLKNKTDHEMISSHLVWNAPTVIEADNK